MKKNNDTDLEQRFIDVKCNIFLKEGIVRIEKDKVSAAELFSNSDININKSPELKHDLEE